MRFFFKYHYKHTELYVINLQSSVTFAAVTSAQNLFQLASELIWHKVEVCFLIWSGVPGSSYTFPASHLHSFHSPKSSGSFQWKVVFQNHNSFSSCQLFFFFASQGYLKMYLSRMFGYLRERIGPHNLAHYSHQLILRPLLNPFTGKCFPWLFAWLISLIL